ncbi:hypothetical protein ACFY0G_32400 [Streptomyces sp. NPDC001552]|uniref:hypothetical protein n=1 Tax=Streptomyces sp. NPDC001552 TaxID=3364587 RepID=UPI0036A4FAFC
MTDLTGSFADQIRALCALAPPLTVTEQVTAHGLEITFHPADPQGCGGGTLVIPAGSAFLVEGGRSEVGEVPRGDEPLLPAHHPVPDVVEVRPSL